MCGLISSLQAGGNSPASAWDWKTKAYTKAYAKDLSGEQRIRYFINSIIVKSDELNQLVGLKKGYTPLVNPDSWGGCCGEHLWGNMEALEVIYNNIHRIQKALWKEDSSNTNTPRQNMHNLQGWNGGWGN